MLNSLRARQGEVPAGVHYYEPKPMPQTDGAGDPPSGERRADRKSDLFAVRDAQLAKSAPPRETEVGDFAKKNLTARPIKA